jgi:hypothetical protein
VKTIIFKKKSLYFFAGRVMTGIRPSASSSS